MPRSVLAWGALALAPWSWFVARDWSPLLDIVAILWPPLIVLLVLTLGAGALLLRRRGLLLVAASCAVLGAAVILEQWVPQRGQPPVEELRVISVNALGQNARYQALVEELVARQPDVLVVAELSNRLHAALAEHFPYSARTDVAQVGIYSRYPITDLPEAPEVVRSFGEPARIDAPGGAFALYALHLPKPGVDRKPEANDRRGGPRDIPVSRQRAIVEELVQAAQAEALPVVIAGDLNLPDRVEGYRELTSELRDAMRSDWTGPTSLRWGPLLVRIDHIFVTRDWCSTSSARFDAPGSDHLGVTSVIGPCPSDG